MRITVDGIPKEKSTKRKWDVDRWNQKTGLPIGNKEDARSVNAFLDTLTLKVNNARTQLIQENITVTSQRLIDIVHGKIKSKAKVLEEFQIHNDEMDALVKTGEYAPGTHERFVTARSHVQQFIIEKYQREDLEFRELDFQFVKDYYFWLRTVRSCSNNTSLKYISNFKKIVLLAIDKNILATDPFKRFKKKKVKVRKKPLTGEQLRVIEELKIELPRLQLVRDIFIFQCYTGLAYSDVYSLAPKDIITGIDGEQWISSQRQKTKHNTDIPLLPKAISILNQYKDHPVCIRRGTVLPVFSNQNMNCYLKEIATLAAIASSACANIELNTHKARRTFATTVALKNGVPIHVVRDILGHESVTQTEEYALTEQESISTEMKVLKGKLQPEQVTTKEELIKEIHNLQARLALMEREFQKQII